MKKNNSKVALIILGAIAVLAVVFFFVNIQAKRSFVRTEDTQMKRHVEIKTL